jgi:hypothetical protein
MTKHSVYLLIHVSAFLLLSGTMVYAFEKAPVSRASGNEGQRNRIYVSVGAADHRDGQCRSSA